MTTTLPPPEDRLKFYNKETNETLVYDSDAGSWNNFLGVEVSGDEMSGTISYPSMRINGNLLTASELLEEYDFDNWTSREAAPDDLSWNDIHFSKETNTWIAVGTTTTLSAGIVMYMRSQDGINWEQAESSEEFVALRSVTYGNGIWVACGISSTGMPVQYSVDGGKNWLSANSEYLRYKQWYGVAYGNGLFMVVGNYGVIATSEDGIVWTEARRPGSTDINSVYFDGDYFFISDSRYMHYSLDGQGWARCGNVGNHINFRGMVKGTTIVGEEVWVAVGTPATIKYSEDGINFKSANTMEEAGGHWESITFGAGYFVAVGKNSTSGFKVYYSTDGYNWTYGTEANDDGLWNGVQYGQQKFVAVSSNGDGRVMVCRPTGIEFTELLFNNAPVVIERERTEVTGSVDALSSRWGTPKYNSSEEPSDSYGIDVGSLWLNPSSAKLSIYHDNEWKQLN